MTPKPTTELEVKEETGVTIISHNQGLCKAITLNDTGYAIWQLIDGKRNTDEISNLLWSEQFSLDHENFKKDILTFIKELIAEGFVETLSE